MACICARWRWCAIGLFGRRCRVSFVTREQRLTGITAGAFLVDAHRALSNWLGFSVARGIDRSPTGMLYCLYSATWIASDPEGIDFATFRMASVPRASARCRRDPVFDQLQPTLRRKLRLWLGDSRTREETVVRTGITVACMLACLMYLGTSHVVMAGPSVEPAAMAPPTPAFAVDSLFSNPDYCAGYHIEEFCGAGLGPGDKTCESLYYDVYEIVVLYPNPEPNNPDTIYRWNFQLSTCATPGCHGP